MDVSREWLLCSPFSGRTIARIALVDGDEPLETGQMRRFMIRDGYGRLYKRQLEEQPIVLRVDDETDLYVQILGFPVDQQSEGFVRINERAIGKPAVDVDGVTEERPRRRPLWQRLFGRD